MARKPHDRPRRRVARLACILVFFLALGFTAMHVVNDPPAVPHPVWLR